LQAFVDCFLDDCLAWGETKISSVLLIYTSFMAKDVECFFRYLLAIRTFSENSMFN
jgi:hypothetical protein